MRAAQGLATGQGSCFSAETLAEVDPTLAPLPSPVAFVRGVVRTVLLVILVVASWGSYWIQVSRLREGKEQARARWLHDLCGRVARLMSMRIFVVGEIPSHGLIVSNHLSYIDIIILSAIAPMVFVSKVEVARWPVFGVAAKLGGTIFLDRERRSAVMPVADLMRGVLKAGIPLLLFPEGTSSGGREVLPFKPALFAPVVELQCPVTPCGITYRIPAGSVADEVCYWGNHTFFPHLINLFGKVGLEARVCFGKPIQPSSDRKALALSLHDEVTALRESTAG